MDIKNQKMTSTKMITKSNIRQDAPAHYETIFSFIPIDERYKMFRKFSKSKMGLLTQYARQCLRSDMFKSELSFDIDDDNNVVNIKYRLFTERYGMFDAKLESYNPYNQILSGLYTDYIVEFNGGNNGKYENIVDEDEGYMMANNVYINDCYGYHFNNGYLIGDEDEEDPTDRTIKCGHNSWAEIKNIPKSIVRSRNDDDEELLDDEGRRTDDIYMTYFNEVVKGTINAETEKAIEDDIVKEIKQKMVGYIDNPATIPPQGLVFIQNCPWFSVENKLIIDDNKKAVIRLALIYSFGLNARNKLMKHYIDRAMDELFN